MPALAGILLGGSASAADLVLHEMEESSLVLPRVTAATGLEASQFEPVLYSELLHRIPPSVRPGSVVGCTGAPTEVQSIAEALKSAANTLFLYDDHETASARLADTKEKLLCVSERLEPELAARLFFLSGVAATRSGDSQAGGAAFRMVHLLQPGATWDTAAGDTGKQLFDAASMAIYMQAPTNLVVRPAVRALWIDGRPVEVKGEVEVPSGEHLLQYGEDPVHTLLVTLESGGGVVVLPAEVPSDTLRWVDDERERPQLGGVMDLLFEPGVRVYVVTESSVWSHVVGSEEWTELWTNVVERAEQTRKRIRWGWAVAGSGGGVSVIGTSLAIAGWQRALRGYEQGIAAHDDAAFLEARASYEQSKMLENVGLAIAAGGLATAAAGLTLTRVERWRLYPDLVGTGMGVRLEVEPP